jgi:hypothetical protein
MDAWGWWEEKGRQKIKMANAGASRADHNPRPAWRVENQLLELTQQQDTQGVPLQARLHHLPLAFEEGCKDGSTSRVEGCWWGQEGGTKADRSLSQANANQEAMGLLRLICFYTFPLDGCAGPGIPTL